MGKRFLGRLKKWAKGEFALLAILLAVILATKCRADRPSNADTEHAASTTDVDNGETYTVRGRVRTITPDRDFIIVQHDTIEGFMDAMTMPFAVRDTALLTGLVSGDSVAFQILVSEGEAGVTSLDIH